MNHSPSLDRDEAANPVLDELIARITDRLQAGEAVDVETYAAEHPDLAEELRRLRPALEMLALAASPPDSEAPWREPHLQGELGDFRLLREVGRGGMGVVYEAEQISLRRRVALKVLPFAAMMDSRHLQRFRNEAQAAACLHHTNIVPVHFVGCERGVHFYAMQFIDGQPLSDLIRQLRQAEQTAPVSAAVRTVAYPESPGETAAAVPTVCVAGESTPRIRVEKRGRDYFRKVAELGEQAAEALDHAHQLGIVHRDIKPANLLLDGRGNLWVTDFGLAHMRHGEANLTLSGQMVGTPRYMSPEQALAQRVPIDHRTDVYSLGATLYELLALHPVFAGEDRQELLQQIAFAEPARLRGQNKAIPAELETIVHKALEKRPQDRYATAQELADDLRRFLLDQPIRARRPSLKARLGRWGRRHKPAVTAGAVVLLMVLGMAGYVGWTRHDRAVRRAASETVVLAALEDSRGWQQQRRLPEALSAARRANGLLAGADVDEALRQCVRARLADLELLDRLENVRLEKGTKVEDGHFDEEGADVLYGQTFRDAGLDVEALSVEEAGERIRGTTVAAELAAVLDHWAVIRQLIRGVDDPSAKVFLRVARVADADAWRTKVREALEQRDPQALRELAASEEVIRLSPATLLVLGTIFLSVKEAPDQVEAFLRAAQRRHPNDFWLNHNLNQFFGALQPPQVEESLRFAAVAVALRPESPGVHLNLGAALKDKGLLDEAIAEYHEAIHLKKDYAEAHSNLGIALKDKGQLDEAIAEHREAIRLKKNGGFHLNLGAALKDKGLLDEAIAEYHEAIRLKKDYALAHSNLGTVLQDKGQLDEAIAEHREAIRLKKDFEGFHYNLGRSLEAKGRLDEAIAEYREAIRLKSDYVDAHSNLGNVLQAKRKLDEAIVEYREAIRLKKDHAQAHFNLGVALYDKGQLDEAIAEFRGAIRFKKDYALAHLGLGNALYDKGQLDGAIAEFREVIRLKKDDAEAHSNLGTALRDKGQLDAAIAEYHEAIRLEKDFAEAHMNLGLALLQKGQFRQSVEALRRGHELGSRKPRWPHPTAQLLQNAERLAQLDERLPAVLQGKDQPKNAAERLGFAQLCHLYRKDYAAAARFYSEAFAAEAKLADDLNRQRRYNAACAAARAGCGQGLNAEKLDSKERARLRQQALDWLRADLKAYRQVMEQSAGKASPAIAQRMQHWLKDDDFAGVRGEEALAKLPEAQREAWQKLWQDVDVLGRPAAATTKVPDQLKRKEGSPRKD